MIGKHRRKAAEIAALILPALPDDDRRVHADAPTMREVVAFVIGTACVIVRKGAAAGIAAEMIPELADETWRKTIRGISYAILSHGPEHLARAEVFRDILLPNGARVAVPNSVEVQVTGTTTAPGFEKVVISRRTGGCVFAGDVTGIHPLLPDDIHGALHAALAGSSRAADLPSDLRTIVAQSVETYGRDTHVRLQIPRGGPGAHALVPAATYLHAAPGEIGAFWALQLDAATRQDEEDHDLMRKAAVAADAVRIPIGDAGLPLEVWVEPRYRMWDGRMTVAIMGQEILPNLFLGVREHGQIIVSRTAEEPQPSDSMRHEVGRFVMRQKALLPRVGPLVPADPDLVDLSAWRIDPPLESMVRAIAADPDAMLRTMIAEGRLSAHVAALLPGAADGDLDISTAAPRLQARIRLGVSVEWAKGVLVVRNCKLPATVVHALPGRAIGDVVAHPWLGDCRIATAKLSDVGDTMTITLDRAA